VIAAAAIDLTSPLRRHIARGVERPGDEDVSV